MDDRHVDRADQAEDRGDPPLPASLAARRRRARYSRNRGTAGPASRSSARPIPTRCPRSAGPRASRWRGRCAVNTAPGTAIARAATAASGWRQTSCIRLATAIAGPARHAEPGGGHVDVEDPHALALQPLGRRERTGPQASATAISAAPAQPSQAVSGRAIFRKRAGFAKTCMVRAVCSEGFAAGESLVLKAYDADERARRHAEPRCSASRSRIGAATCFGFMAAMIKLGDEAGVTPARAGLLPLRLRPAAACCSGSPAPAISAPGAPSGRSPISWRGVLGLSTMVLAFSALTFLPLAEAATIGFAAPLFAVMLSALILGEPVGRHRWSAVALGFVGVLIVMRPSGSALPPLGLALALAGGVRRRPRSRSPSARSAGPRARRPSCSGSRSSRWPATGAAAALLRPGA